MPASNSVKTVERNFAVDIRVYSPLIPEDLVKASMIGSTAVMLA